MKDFEGFIKNYATRDFIYFFAEKSIEIYKNQVEKLDEHLVCNITFPLNIIQHGFIHKSCYRHGIFQTWHIFLSRIPMITEMIL